MFLDLDKPVLRDPLEQIEAAMEWEAISEMNALRDEERRRLGFVKDLHEERGFALNPITGRYRDAPGFNPPRRIERQSYDDLPIELKSFIIENVGGFVDRTPTRLISTSHAILTEGFDDIMVDVVSSILKENPLPETIDPCKSNIGCVSNDVSGLIRTLYLVLDMTIKRLGIPITVSPSDFLEGVADISLSEQEPPGYASNINVSLTSSQGILNLVLGYARFENGNPWNTLGPSHLLKYYPTIRRILTSLPKYIVHIAEVRTKYLDEHYEKFRRKGLIH